MMDRIAPTPPDFTITLDDLPIYGVSDRLERRIRLQFAAVLIGAAVVVVAIVARLGR